MADMTAAEIAAHLETLTDAEIIPDGSQGWPDLTTQDVTVIADYYRQGINDSIWLQIEERGGGGLPYTKQQMLLVLKLCQLDVKRRQEG